MRGLVRVARLCVRLAVAHISFLCCRVRAELHAAAITASEREETPPSLNGTMALCRSPSLWANYERIPNISDFSVDLKRERREGGGAPDGHLGGGSFTASRGRGVGGRGGGGRVRDK